MVTPGDVVLRYLLDAKRQRITEFESLMASLKDNERRNVTLPSPEENQFYEQGLVKLHETEYGAAIKIFQTYQKTNPNSILAKTCQFWIGRCYYNLGDFNDAIKAFEGIINDKCSPRYEEALMMIAFSLEKICDFRGAHSYYSRLMEERADSEYIDIAFRRLITLQSKIREFKNYN